MSQSLENANTNAVNVVPIDEDMPMVVDDLDDEITWIERREEKAWELAKA